MPPGSMQRLSLRGSLFCHGIQNVSISYFAGYQQSETLTIPQATPFSVTLKAPLGFFASDQGVKRVGGTALTRVDQQPDPGQYTVVSGRYSFNTAEAGAPVVITYGYVPMDIAMAAKEWAAERYSYHARIGQSSKSLGGQETVAFIVKDVPDFVAHMLQPYRCVVTP